MSDSGRIYHFDKAPDYYLLDDHLHVVDRIDGKVVLHKIYPVAVISSLAKRARGVSRAARLIGKIAHVVRHKKRKKD